MQINYAIFMFKEFRRLVQSKACNLLFSNYHDYIYTITGGFSLRTCLPDQ